MELSLIPADFLIIVRNYRIVFEQNNPIFIQIIDSF